MIRVAKFPPSITKHNGSYFNSDGRYNGKPSSKSGKLYVDLGPSYDDIYLDEYLDCMVENCGLVVTKVHEEYEFAASYKINDFILKMAEKRKEYKKAKNDTGSNAVKLTINSIYSKTIEDVEKES